MNKRGFTLVELLAVIVILSLLALITGTAITNMVKDSKDDLYDVQVNLIKSAAETWGAENIKYLPNSGSCLVLTVKDLKDSGLLESDLTDPRNNTPIDDTLKIKISGTESSIGKNVISYEVDPEDVSSCIYVYSGSSGGTIPCGVESGSIDTVGSEIVCGTESFYVLSSTDTTVTMLSAKNIRNTDFRQYDTSYGLSYSNAQTAINIYKNILTSMGLKNVSTSILNEDQLHIMGCSTVASMSCPMSELKSPFDTITHSTWTSVTASSDMLVFYPRQNRSFEPVSANATVFGILPVVTTDKSSIALFAS